MAYLVEKVVSGLEIARKVSSHRSVGEWAAAEHAAARTPDTGRMRAGPDGVYQSLGEFDNVITIPDPGGRLRIVEVEETKTGGESAAEARRQVASATSKVIDVAEGRSDARVFEKGKGNNLGPDVTDAYDLSSARTAPAKVRGLLGRSGFDRTLPFDRPTLEQVARQLVTEGLPPESTPAVGATPGAFRERERKSQ